jgi:hypothetical protein
MRAALLLVCAALPAVRCQGNLACFLKFGLFKFQPEEFDLYPT